MKELAHYLVKNLVDKPEQVTVEASESNGAIRLNLQLADGDKGKIIGKEGRNIRTFERATGVDVLVDETPGMITLSCFDPVRRQIARVALENLIIDGRIQPAKIEEIIEKMLENGDIFQIQPGKVKIL